jgi:predicted DNA-binding transcriptional regulator AlpA
MQPKRLLSRREARKLAGNISRTTEFRLLRDDPDWPKPVQISAGLSGYVEEELQAFIEARMKARGEARSGP